MPIVVCPRCGAKNRVDEQRADQSQPVCGRCGEKLNVARGAGAPGHPIEVTDATFDRDVLAAGAVPVLVDFWAAWCGPCRMLAPALEQLAAESGGRYVVAKLNTDENPRAAARYRIEALPSLIVFKNGEPVDRIVGLVPKQQIAQKLAQHT